ncbi:EpsG family protein [Citrobacter portucalensis]|uniref:EpsG family protein n=1 Tax=Citrobacter TaxID=544 RepID=UPI0010A2ABF5|nr:MULTISPECIES: EpsG family protein [Citrobacter]MDM3284434.1 EpsG family protein [Citrobacter sp. Cf042]MDN4260706.1 EpsG family protein [Citrobacter freundii]MEB0885969.1 EpsG family protein [Citrobacter freundii]QCD02450.1 EpsG family protein [Citrobacter portucalensis]HCB1585221.1 EpsG family protein [Citrobacter freundii]
MYIVILIYLFFCSLANSKHLTTFNIFVTFIIMSGWYFPAYDWINYYDFYSRIDDVALFNNTFEPGFTALMKISAWMGLEYHSVYILSNVIIYFFVYRYCIKFRYSGFVFFFIFALFGFVLFAEQIRQGIALAILLFASRRRKFLLYALVACMFHYSAVFAIALDFIINSKEKNRKKMVFIFSGGALVLLGFLAFDVNSAMVSFISNKISNHLNVDILASSFTLGLMLYFIFSLFCLYKKKENIVNKKWQCFCFGVILLGVPFPVFNRFTYYCYPYLIPDIENLFSKYVYRGILILTIVFVIGLRIVISPIYLPLMSDYHFHLPGVTESPDYDSIRKGHCEILRSNGINDFC